MSYIRAKVVEQEDPAAVNYGFRVQEVDFEERPTLDMNLDDEMLAFVIGLIEKVDSLAEGEALIVWKEVF